MGLENPTHLLFLAIVVLLIFGPKRLPELGRSLGSGMRHFKQSLNTDEHAEAPPKPGDPQPPAAERDASSPSAASR